MKKQAVFLAVFCVIAIIALAACNLPIGQSAAAPDVAGSVTAQLAIEQAAQTLVAGTMKAQQPAQSEAPAVPAQPLDTLAPTLTPTLAFTPTPEGVFLVLSKDTYCREGGPFSSFRVIVTVKAGDKVEVLFTNPEKDSYYVKNPYQGGSYCWLWGKYATLTGNSAGLTVATMQATPTPTLTPTPAADFSVSYVSLEHCGANYAFKLYVKNTGGIVWQSINLTGSDTVTHFAFNQSLNVFKEYVGCASSTTQGDLTPGEYSYVLNTEAGQYFVYNPTGHLISLTLTLCSTDGMAGTCKSVPLSFTP